MLLHNISTEEKHKRLTAAPLVSRPTYISACPELSSGGAGAGILSYQDSLKHILWRSILGFLPRTVLVRQYPHPSFSLTLVHLSETTTL